MVSNSCIRWSMLYTLCSLWSAHCDCLICFFHLVVYCSFKESLTTYASVHISLAISGAHRKEVLASNDAMAWGATAAAPKAGNRCTRRSAVSRGAWRREGAVPPASGARMAWPRSPARMGLERDFCATTVLQYSREVLEGKARGCRRRLLRQRGHGRRHAWGQSENRCTRTEGEGH